MDPVKRSTVQLWLNELDCDPRSQLTQAQLSTFLSDREMNMKIHLVDDKVKSERIAYDNAIADFSSSIIHTEAAKEYLRGVDKLLHRIIPACEKAEKWRPKSPRAAALAQLLGFVSPPRRKVKLIRDEAAAHALRWSGKLTEKDRASLVHPTDIFGSNPKGLKVVHLPIGYNLLDVRVLVADSAENYFDPYVDNTRDYLINFLKGLLEQQ